MNMHTAKLGATPERWNRFAGVQKLIGIEGLFDRVELLQLLIVELYAHLVYFFHANAVFAGDRESDRVEE